MSEQSAKSYTDLYMNLVQLKRQEWARPASKLLLLLSSLTWLYILLLLILNPYSGLLLIGVGVIINLLFVLAWFLVWLLYAIWIGSRNALTNVNELAAKLLLSQEGLVAGQRGLMPKELQQLKAVAEIEQNAADWRGNFINFVVVGLLFGAVAFLLEPPASLQRWREAAQSTAQTPANVDIPGFLTGLPPGLASLLNSFYLVVAVIVLLLVLVRLARYFGDFIAHEATNRQIQLACLEAIDLLQREGLSTQTPLSLANKRRVARLLGFRLRGSYIHTLRTPLFVDEAERAWHLMPLKRPYFSISLWFHEWSVRYFMKQRLKKKS